MTTIKAPLGTLVFSMVNGVVKAKAKGYGYGRSRIVRHKKDKKITTAQYVEYLLTKLTKAYSREKTEEDYEKILKSLTHDQGLIDETLIEWGKILEHIE